MVKSAPWLDQPVTTSVDGTSISVTSGQNGGDGPDSDDASTTTNEEAFASATTENLISLATTVAHTIGSQAPGFGLLVTVLGFTRSSSTTICQNL